ncbi:MAG: O-antigen ligase family protein [Chloroflexota bacterium]|nr:O-antigen ligase family protein [Chloroflexota bacterium]
MTEAALPRDSSSGKPAHPAQAGARVTAVWRAIELILLIGLVISHWAPDPARINSLILFIPIFAGRAVVLRRLITRTPIDYYLAALIALCVLNIAIAPYTWGMWSVSRVVMGVGIVWVIGDWGRTPGALRALLVGTAGFAALVGVVALLTSQYTIKSSLLQGIIDALPRLRDLPLVGAGFNVNEIGGALCLLAPAAAALALTDRVRVPGLTRALAWAALITLTAALLLGQSRMAIIGALIGGVVAIFLVMRAGVRRQVALAGLVAIAVLEMVLALNLLVPSGLAVQSVERDVGSQIGRTNIWRAGIEVLRDYPLTGVGINQFRTRAVRARYPVEGYETAILPHAHNLVLQIGADLGLPGIALYVGWSAAWIGLLWRAWRMGDGVVRTIAAGLGAAWAAHMIFNLADAITLFDRWIWLYWLLIGLGVAAARRVIVRTM